MTVETLHLQWILSKGPPMYRHAVDKAELAKERVRSARTSGRLTAISNSLRKLDVDPHDPRESAGWYRLSGDDGSAPPCHPASRGESMRRSVRVDVGGTSPSDRRGL